MGESTIERLGDAYRHALAAEKPRTPRSPACPSRPGRAPDPVWGRLERPLPPFVWTKPADQILAKANRQTTSATNH